MNQKHTNSENELRHKGSNAGVSLIEVLVSMLLLAILILPLLNSFVISAKTNTVTKKKLYADAVAQNVMEGLKKFGFEETAFQFNGLASDGKLHVVNSTALSNPSYGIGFYEMNASGSKIDYTDPNSDCSIQKVGEDSYKIRQNDSRTYYYMIKDLKEGTQNFDVKITYSADGHYDGDDSELGQNTYQLPDVTNLDSMNTALINPVSSYIEFSSTDGTYDTDANGNYYFTKGQSYDDRAVAFFKDKHETKLRNEWLAKCEENMNAAVPTPTPPAEVSEADILKVLKRSLVIELKSDPNTSGNVLVESRYIYEITRPDMVDEAFRTKEYVGFYRQSFSDLENIYIFHPPFTNISDLTTSKDFIIIKNSLPESQVLNVFLALQTAADGITANNIEVTYEGHETSGKMRLFYDRNTMNTIKYNNINAEDINSNLVDVLPSKDRIYQVSVEVYEAGTNKRVAYLTSTSMD